MLSLLLKIVIKISDPVAVCMEIFLLFSKSAKYKEPEVDIICRQYRSAPACIRRLFGRVQRNSRPL